MVDKYGVGQDPYCYADSDVLRNLLNIQDEEPLQKAERELSEIAVSKLRLLPPPYDLSVLKHIHKSLFCDVYEWARIAKNSEYPEGRHAFLYGRTNHPRSREDLSCHGTRCLVRRQQ